ncbi:MAG: PLP-dependent aminotransferase family protein [Pseudomonadota bacterium]
MWTPDIDGIQGPLYMRITDALADDVASGRLPAGTRLPTHRELAYRLGVTVGTISRAYAEADRRGLTIGEVGRGTFVRALSESPARAVEAANILPYAYSPETKYRLADRQGPHLAEATGTMEAMIPLTRDESVTRYDESGVRLIDFSLNRPASVAHEEALRQGLIELSGAPNIARLLDYTPHRGLPDHREAAAEIVTYLGLETNADQIMITAGAQHAMTLAFATLAGPGETVLTESLTYHGCKALAATLRQRLEGVAMDRDGMMPDALDVAARRTGAKVVYMMPTLQNPTCSIMPDSRRAEIVDVARQHGLTIIEDDIYGFLSDVKVTSIADMAPDITVHLSSASKCISPGLRIGWVRASEHHLARMTGGMRATMWMAPTMQMEIVAQWVHNGTFQNLMEWQRREAGRRQAVAQTALKGYDIQTQDRSFHMWLHLPDPWRASEFASAARRRGVLVTPAGLFTIGRNETPHAVRVCLAAVPSQQDLDDGLAILSQVLSTPADAQLSVV